MRAQKIYSDGKRPPLASTALKEFRTILFTWLNWNVNSTLSDSQQVMRRRIVIMEENAPQIQYMKEEANTVPLILVHVKNTEGNDKKT